MMPNVGHNRLAEGGAKPAVSQSVLMDGLCVLNNVVERRFIAN